jgi:hypothetical protein
MIGSYDDISHRLSELFYAREMHTNTDYLNSGSDGDHSYLRSPQWGDMKPTWQNDLPATLCWYVQHSEGSQPWVNTYPKNVEQALLGFSGTNSYAYWNVYNSATGVPHYHPVGPEFWWEIVVCRMFPERENNVVYNIFPVRSDFIYSGSATVNYGAGGEDSRRYDSDPSVPVLMGGMDTTVWTFYHTSTISAASGYDYEGHSGPVISLDVALSDDEIHHMAASPYDILRKYWGNVSFAVSPMTGEDFGPHRNHWTTNYSNSTVAGQVESTSPQGLIPGIDHSSTRVSGRWKAFFDFVDTGVTGDANLATSTATAFQPAAAGIATGDANLATSTATAFQPAAAGIATGDANLATSTATAFHPSVTGASVTGDANLATSTATAFQPAAAGIATGDANLATSTATAFHPSVIQFPATGDANLATSTVTAFTCTTTGGVSIAVILNDAVTIPLTIPDSVTIPMTVRDSVILPSEV